MILIINKKNGRLEEVLHNLDNLVKMGKIRYIGLSNETAWGIMKYLNYSRNFNLQNLFQFRMVTTVNRTFDIAIPRYQLEKNDLIAHSALQEVF